MSSSEDIGGEQAPLTEGLTAGYLVEAEYEQDLVQALQEANASPGTPEAAGKYGLLRIPVGSVPSNGKLEEQLQKINPAALGQYGRNRLCAIGALAGDPKVWGGQNPRALTANDSDPKVWGGQNPRALTANDSDPKVWGRPALAEGCHTIRPEAAPPESARSTDDAGLGVVIAVLDTKISTHDYLTGGFLASPDSIDFVPDGQPLSAASGHATFVVGLILQQAPAATVYLKRVLNDQGVCDSITLHDAIIDLAKQPIDILNLSLGCTTADNRAPFAVRRALERFRAERPHAIVVAAAGNHPGDRRFWPAALPGVLAVTSASRAPDDSWDETAEFPVGPWVDVAAPGTDLISTFLEGSHQSPPDSYQGPDEAAEQKYAGWATGSGTSFACALAAGYLARIWAPGRRIDDLLATARHAGAPVTRSGGRLVLGAGQPAR